ncbi:MAG: pyridoxamine kinase [Spirochaetia bacterium]|nr:pyridoxamine kinase [Spirochaetia bacterium]
MQKKCAAFHDLSCYAKSSLTVVLPVLEVMGIETCPVPTALLSSQTDGFDTYYFEDTTKAHSCILDAWDALDLSFDAIYSGFLGSDLQVQRIMRFVQNQRKKARPLVLVDPVLGDEKQLYGPITDAMVCAMRSLVCVADVITPNATEAALLLKEPFQESFSKGQALRWAGQLSLQTGAMVAITSVLLGKKHVVACCDKEHEFCISYKQLPVSYPGSGDLFASLLLGNLLGEKSFQSSVEQAVCMTSLAIERTKNARMERRHGVAVTSILSELAQKRDAYAC